MAEKLGVETNKIPELNNLLYKNYGTTMAVSEPLAMTLTMMNTIVNWKSKTNRKHGVKQEIKYLRRKTVGKRSRSERPVRRLIVGAAAFPWRSGKVWSLGGRARSCRAAVCGGVLAIGRQTKKKKTYEVTNENGRKWEG
ncbi:suppressor of disruption of TFIIS [Cucumis melo var. makuwa]|uniref:Suppressor of disruption of TFIIS n=1 Tax=Cucumis melo var. makuwa TaxID=1194695 RepID=A0A5D3DU19_CUCMM|nr:suppressor of disruption of TFIIS [Cucumis melo var. makuwa]